MKISKDMRKNYPKLSQWIETNLPKVICKKRVWNAFLKYCELSTIRAIIAITPGFFSPEIRYAIMPNANGEFRGSTQPDRIFLAKAICERFEKSDSNKKSMHLLVESTLLHEMVHWGDWKDGKDQAGEEGKAFEQAAYGKDVGRYW